MEKKKKLSVQQKSSIITLLSENYSNCDIAHRIGCSECTVRNVKKKYEETGNVERKKGSGRPRATTKKEEALLKRLCLRDRFASSSKLRSELAQVQNKPCSTRTVQRRLKEMGLNSRRPAKKPLLTNKMRHNRFQWSKEHQNWTSEDWKTVIFSDESKFNLMGRDGVQNVRRRQGERYNDECILPIVKHSPYIMVWGAMTAFGLGRILVVEGAIDATKYKEIIKKGVVPTIEELYAHTSNVLFQDDSAPCHRAMSVSIFDIDRINYFIFQTIQVHSTLR